MADPILVLMYHAVLSVGDAGDWLHPQDHPYTVTEDEFARHLALLAESGCAIVDPRDAELFPGVASDSPPAYDTVEKPARLRILLTFDDAWRAHEAVARPMLARHGWQGVVFVTPRQIGEAHMMTVAGISRLAEAGWRIGAHGLTHHFLADLDEQALSQELATARDEIAVLTGSPVTWLSLPGGRGGIREVKAAHAQGYSAVFGSVPGLWGGGSAGIIPRMVIRTGAFGCEQLRTVLSNPAATLTAMLRRKQRLEWMKRLLGNRVYHQLHAWWFGAAVHDGKA